MTEKETIEHITRQMTDHAVLLYMKGSPQMPQCGFSAQAVQLLEACGVAFSFVDVLANPDIRQWLPSVASWPTFPQLYIQGELVGGCDIMRDLHQQGELQAMLQHINADEA